MAIWQYDLYLVPETAEGVHDVEPPAIVEDLELAQVWRDVRAPTNVAARLSRILPEFASWDPRLRWFGSEEGNRIDVWRRGDSVREVRVRIDVRRLEAAFLKDVLLLATEWNCLLFAPEPNVLFRPVADELVLRLRECDARVFLLEQRRRRGRG